MWKVGQLAQRAGVTVRTLHHYDALGLLLPSARTDAGYRLYSDADAERLARIVLLRGLGLSLDEVRACLDRPDFALAPTLARHIERLEADIAAKTEALHQLRSLERRIREVDVGSAKHLELALEAVKMVEHYYSQEQLDRLEQRRQEVGDERIAQVQQEWEEVFDAFREAMADQLPPGHPQVQALVKRSNALIAEFTGGHAGVTSSLNRMYAQEGGPPVLSAHGMEMDQALWDYMGRARQAAPIQEP
ncbi:MAG: MerR family transcriptional regulator [Myxococcota bacterium]